MKFKQFMVTILIGIISTTFMGCGLLRKDLHDSSTVNPTSSLEIVTVEEIEQGKDFKMGFRYFPKEVELIEFKIHIFNILGELHFKKEFKIEDPEITYNSIYDYYLTDIKASEFSPMSVGLYKMTISYDNEVKAKVNISVKPQKKNGTK